MLHHLDNAARFFFCSGFSVLARASFADDASRNYTVAKAAVSKAETAATSAWRKWAVAAFQVGASQDHRSSKARSIQEVLSAGAPFGPVSFGR